MFKLAIKLTIKFFFLFQFFYLKYSLEFLDKFFISCKMVPSKFCLISIFLVCFCNIEIVENCKKTETVVVPFFQSTKAVAPMKGRFNGSTISGAISFEQKVIFLHLVEHLL